MRISSITPAVVKTGLNKQQKKVPQLPSLFKPKNINVLGSKTDPQHPTKNFFVGGESLESHEDSAVARAITHRIAVQHPSLLSRYGIENVLSAINDTADFVGDVDEIGSSDVSGWVRQVIDTLAQSSLDEGQQWFIKINGTILLENNNKPFIVDSAKQASAVALAMRSRPQNRDKTFTISQSLYEFKSQHPEDFYCELFEMAVNNIKLREAGIPFRGVGGAFNRGDDERHDLDVPRQQSPQVWGLKINGTVDSNNVFNSKDRALKQRLSLLARNPELEIGLVTKGGEQGVAEGVAETMPMQDAQKVLNHYGADYFKTTHDTLYFSKYRKQFSISRIRDDDSASAGSVNLSDLNDIVRKLRDMRVPLSPFGEGVAEGNDPWGDQGNFAGDKPVNVGDVSMKNIQTGDTVKYLGQPSEVVAMSKDRKYSRITITKGMGTVTQDVLTSDLQQLGRGVGGDSLNELSTDLLRKAAVNAKQKSSSAENQWDNPAMKTVAKHYDTLSNKFGGRADKVAQKDAVKKFASPAAMRKMGMAEGAEFGSYYSEELAQKVFAQNPNLDISGRANAYFDAAWPFMVADLGKKSATYQLNSEDFPSDTVSAYSYLQKQGVTEAGNANSGRRGPNYQDNSPVVQGRVELLPQGLRHHADSSRYGGTEPDDEDDRLMSRAQRHRLHKAVTPDDLDEAKHGVAKKPQPYNDPGWAKDLPKEKLDALAGPRYNKNKKQPIKNAIIKGISATEDVVSADKKRLSDYLNTITQTVKKDPSLLSKIKPTNDISSAVKTIKTDDGHELKIYGNEDDGFRISIKNNPSKSKFTSMEEAVMACEMYCAKRNEKNMSADYISEE